MTHGPVHSIVIALKNLPVVHSIPALIAPTITRFTTVVLIQNGTSIEQSFVDYFPDSTILPGVSMLGAHELNGEAFYFKSNLNSCI